MSTMSIRSVVFGALAFATVTGTAMADDRTNLTPPLYREQARATANVRPVSDLTTTPSLTSASAVVSQVEVETTGAVR
ncbi:hypothetical protein FV219_00605 [Methylobacterium sp. WL122]|nr:hypothetical protein FV219_00605 [Methylobacterium sp. WL122]